MHYVITDLSNHLQLKWDKRMLGEVFPGELKYSNNFCSLKNQLNLCLFPKDHIFIIQLLHSSSKSRLVLCMFSYLSGKPLELDVFWYVLFCLPLQPCPRQFQEGNTIPMPYIMYTDGGVEGSSTAPSTLIFQC